MTSLHERALKLIENITPICPKNLQNLFWEEFIITIKSEEVIAWSFNCLTCDQKHCPLSTNSNQSGFVKENIRNYA